MEKLYGLEEKTGYWKLTGEALDGNQWRTDFGRGRWPVVRLNIERIIETFYYPDK